MRIPFLRSTKEATADTTDATSTDVAAAQSGASKEVPKAPRRWGRFVLPALLLFAVVATIFVFAKAAQESIADGRILAVLGEQ